MPNLSPEELQKLILAAIELVVAAGLGSARAIGIMLVLPVFTRPQIGGLVRGALAIAITLPMLQHVADAVATLDGGTRMVKVALLGLKEVFVGLLLGTLLSIPLWSIQAVGEIVDTQRGITSETAPVDPATRSQASATGLLLGITAITIFVVSGGLQTMVDGLYKSYLIWPVVNFMPSLSTQGAMELVSLLDHIMRTMLLIAGPVLIFLLLIDISVMLLGRFAPQFKPNDLAPTLKNIGFAIFMVVYAVYLMEYMKAEITQTQGVLEQFRKVLK
ncbi:type III secretion system export apparatus subunit SctT [Bosea sp. (in: a-proteobacteria)]|jgi:type III secretion protein T|uniref:type III secretion system export apparatus subunit SctT n=1 Tax=Bosea sp. (in: a-proteobacteria) TaxID=1871050 RepID=UPI003F71C7B2